MGGFLNITIPSPADVFWNCFRDSYNANPNGIDGKIRILSIIGESFIYKNMIDELEVKKIVYFRVVLCIINVPVIAKKHIFF